MRQREFMCVWLWQQRLLLFIETMEGSGGVQGIRKIAGIEIPRGCSRRDLLRVRDSLCLTAECFEEHLVCC